MQTFPINLRLADVPVLVVGGGAVAAEKLERLVPHRPRLTLVCPDLAPQTAALVATHGILHRREGYRPEHLDGQRLVFAATSDPALQRRIYDDTRSRGLWVNTVDVPATCDFILPAVVAGQHFSLAISTGGLAAGYARHLREELEAAVQQEDGVLEVLEAIRAMLKRKVSTFDARRERLREILRELDELGGDA